MIRPMVYVNMPYSDSQTNQECQTLIPFSRSIGNWFLKWLYFMF